MQCRVSREIARAKVNLTLHVVGRRDDGYHELDSLVAFAAHGDEVVYEADTSARATSVDGPYAAAIDGPNLIDQVVLAVSRWWDVGERGSFRLLKNIPVAAGLGGGSADAAAALRLLCRALGDDDHHEDRWKLIARSVGADVPVCLGSRLSVMRGTGERTTILPAVEPLPAVLVNPGVRLSTRDVFEELRAPAVVGSRDADQPAGFTDPAGLVAAIASGRNDLEAPAMRLQPVIGDVLAAIGETQQCRVARMSGSGPTCFGVYPTSAAAQSAAAQLLRRQPHWWVVATELS